MPALIFLALCTRNRAATLPICFSSRTCLFVMLKVEFGSGKLVLAGELGNKEYRWTERWKRNVDRQNAGHFSRQRFRFEGVKERLGGVLLFFVIVGLQLSKLFRSIQRFGTCGRCIR